MLSEQTEPHSMDADEYRAALQAIGYSQERFARLVGVTPRTGQKWALGEARVPGPVIQLLALLLEAPGTLAILEARPDLPTRTRVDVKKPAKRRKAKGRG